MVEGDQALKATADIGYGKGCARAIPAWSWIISQLEQLRSQRKMAVVLLSQSKVSGTKLQTVRATTDTRQTCISLAAGCCRNGATKCCLQRAEFSSRSKKKVSTRRGRSRSTARSGISEPAESASSLAKNRLSLPEELPLEWSAYMAAVSKHYAAHAQPEATAEATVNVSGIVVDGSSKPPAAEVDPEYQEFLAEAAKIF